MRCGCRLRKDSQSTTDPPSNPTWDEGESSLSGDYRALMQAIQALSTSVQRLMAQQPPPLGTDEVKPKTRPVLPPPPKMGKPIKFLPTTTYHKAFMSAKPPSFSGNEGSDWIEGSLRKIEKAINIIEVSDRLKVRFETYMLVDNVEAW